MIRHINMQNPVIKWKTILYISAIVNEFSNLDLAELIENGDGYSKLNNGNTLIQALQY